MMNRIVAIAAAALAVGAWTAPAMASTVYMDAKYYDGTATFTDSTSYTTEWEKVSSTYTPGYLDQSFTDWSDQHNSGKGGASTNLAYHDFVGFDVTSANKGTWAFRMGIDFGDGGTLIVDGTPLDTSTSNLWWNGQIDDQSQTLYGSIDLAPGYHTLDVYGFEDCCDGGTTSQFLAPNAQQGYSSNFGSLAALEPASWIMMLVGFGGMGVLLRTQRREGVLSA